MSPYGSLIPGRGVIPPRTPRAMARHLVTVKGGRNQHRLQTHTADGRTPPKCRSPREEHCMQPKHRHVLALLSGHERRKVKPREWLGQTRNPSAGDCATDLEWPTCWISRQKPIQFASRPDIQPRNIKKQKQNALYKNTSQSTHKVNSTATRTAV